MNTKLECVPASRKYTANKLSVDTSRSGGLVTKDRFFIKKIFSHKILQSQSALKASAETKLEYVRQREQDRSDIAAFKF